MSSSPLFTEDSPPLRSMSIRAFVHHLDEVDQTTTGSPFVKKAAAPPPLLRAEGNDSEHDETVIQMVQPSLLTDIQPRPLAPLTILSRSTITTDLNHHDVLERIETLIRAKSLDYTVDLDTASIECQTTCDLNFALYFWVNQEGQVLVEIQRRNGCAILMQRVRQTLFRALNDGSEEQESSTTTHPRQAQEDEEESSWLQRCPLHMTVSPRVKQMMDHDQHENKQQEDNNDTSILQESLEICEEQLCSERRDLQILALESLVHLTDPQNCSLSTARFVAQALLSHDCVGRRENHLHCELVETLRSSTRHRHRESFKYEYTGGCEAPVVQEQYDKQMAILSLTTLYNAIKVVRSCHNGHGSVVDMSSHSWRRIASSLKESLCDPTRHAQDAIMAARCIRRMEELDDRTSDFFADAEPIVEHLIGETTTTRHGSMLPWQTQASPSATIS